MAATTSTYKEFSAFSSLPPYRPSRSHSKSSTTAAMAISAPLVGISKQNSDSSSSSSSFSSSYSSQQMASAASSSYSTSLSSSSSTSSSRTNNTGRHVTFYTPSPAPAPAPSTSGARRSSRHVTFEPGTRFTTGSDSFRRRAKRGKARNPATLVDRESPQYLEALRTWAAEKEYL